MNLAIRGIGGQIAHGDTFRNDRHPDLKADFILANHPFNVSDWGGERLAGDKRWRYGVPPKGNANFAWVQHMVHHLAPMGVAGFVLANGSMSSSQSGEGQIRKNLIEAELVDCMVALPGQLFYSTQIPACLWFLARRRTRRGEILFIDARKARADGGPDAPGADRRRNRADCGHLPRLADGRGGATTTLISPASARVRHWTRWAGTVTSRRRAATSGSSPSGTMASPSKRR